MSATLSLSSSTFRPSLCSLPTTAYLTLTRLWPSAAILAPLGHVQGEHDPGRICTPGFLCVHKRRIFTVGGRHASREPRFAVRDVAVLSQLDRGYAELRPNAGLRSPHGPTGGE